MTAWQLVEERGRDGERDLFFPHHYHRRHHHHQCQRRVHSKYLENFALYKLNFFNHNSNWGVQAVEEGKFESQSHSLDGNNMTIMTLLTVRQHDALPLLQVLTRWKMGEDVQKVLHTFLRVICIIRAKTRWSCCITSKWNSQQIEGI